MNDAIGGKTQPVGPVSAAVLLFTIFFVGDVLAYIPSAALGSAVLASAAVDLIDVRGLVALWRLSRIESLVSSSPLVIATPAFGRLGLAELGMSFFQQ